YVPPRTYDRLLPAPRRGAQGRGVDGGAPVAEPPRDPPRPHALRQLHGAGDGHDGAAVPGWGEWGGEVVGAMLGWADAIGALTMARSPSTVAPSSSTTTVE